MNSRGALIFAFTLLASMALVAGSSSAATPDIIQVPPYIRNINFDFTGASVNVIDIDVEELNGEGRIWKVDADVSLDGETVASFGYRQYESINESVYFDDLIRADIFVNYVGDALIIEDCTFENRSLEWTSDMDGWRVHFEFEKVEFDRITVTVTDLGNLTATATAEFPSGWSGMCTTSYVPMLAVAAFCPVLLLTRWRSHE